MHRVSSVFGHRWKRTKCLGPQKEYAIVGEKVGGWWGGAWGGQEGRDGAPGLADFCELLVSIAGENEARAIRTPNLLIWNQTRYHCAIAPLNKELGPAVLYGLRVRSWEDCCTSRIRMLKHQHFAKTVQSKTYLNTPASPILKENTFATKANHKNNIK